MDPRPTLDLDCLERSAPTRDREFRALLRALTRLPDADRKQLQSVMSKFRRRHRRKCSDPDPNPYDPVYLFYCLTGEREIDT
jgi:hypothetical protein